MDKFDVIVVGGGHAGAEAAFAVSRSGLSCALITMDQTKIGQMSCNPAIGGLGKSHIVREIDAMGGLMGRATDLSGIQYRTLNTRKGDAVQALRVQCDRDLYKKAVQKILKEIFIFSPQFLQKTVILFMAFMVTGKLDVILLDLTIKKLENFKNTDIK